jgi:hypothetical protein
LDPFAKYGVDGGSLAKAGVVKLWYLSSLQANHEIGLPPFWPLPLLHLALARLKILVWH